MAATPGVAPWHGADGVARRTSPLTVAVAGASLVGGVIALIVGTAIQDAIAAAATSSDQNSPPFALLVPGIALVLTGAVRVLQWITTTYAVLPDELVVDSGLLNREHRVFPYARIQQADTHQNLVGQILGLTELKVDVAGSSGSTQMRLRLLDQATAVGLRDHLLLRRAQLHAVEHPVAESTGGAAPGAPAGTTDRVGLGPIGLGTGVAAGERTILRLTPARIALAAITQAAVVLAVPVLAVAGLSVGAALVVGGSNRLGGGAIAVVALGLSLVVIVAAVLGGVLTSFGFVVSLAGDDIHLRYGLLETRNLTVPRRRVQQVTILDNPVRRRLGLVELHLHSAAAPGGESTTRFVIPVIDAATVDELLRTLMGTDRWRIPPLAPRPAAARRRAIVRRTALLAIALVVPAVLLRPAGVVLLAFAGLGVVWGEAAHRRAGHGRSAEVVAFAHGVLVHRVDLVPIERVQSGRTDQSIFQRRVGLATILLDVAGSRSAPYLWDLDLDTAAALRRTIPRASRPAPT